MCHRRQDDPRVLLRQRQCESDGKDGEAKYKSIRSQANRPPPTSNLHLRNGKASLHEPCFVVWPGVTKPGTVVQNIDWMLTLW